MTKAKPEPGDWVGLALHWGVPGVTRSTPREKAIDRLLDHLAEGMLAELGPPEGWTVEQYREWRKHRYD